MQNTNTVTLRTNLSLVIDARIALGAARRAYAAALAAHVAARTDATRAAVNLAARDRENAELALREAQM